MSTLRLRFGVLFMSMLFLGTTLDIYARETKKEEADKYIKVLKTSKDANAKVEAYKGLGELSQVQVSLALPAVPLFVEGLKDKDATIRAAAAANYGKIDLSDKADQLKSLIDLVKNDKDEKVKEGAARGLGAMGSNAKEAIPAIKEAASQAAEKTKNKKAPPAYRDVMMQINSK